MITDAEGLTASYNSPNNMYIHNKTLFISGTHSVGDVFTDLTIPFHLLPYTQRYIDADNILKKNKYIDTIVSHSLGSAIAAILIQEPQIKQGRSYGAPTVFAHKKLKSFRHYGDPVSISNRVAGDSETNLFIGNPHSYEGFETFYN